MSYADLTINDGNPIKRALQRRRLEHGLRWLTACPADFAGTLLDLGAGDGVLSRRLALRFPRAMTTCCEPASSLREQAVANLQGLENVQIVARLADSETRRYDWIFCLEVFEHLPRRETRRLLADMLRVADEETTIVIGVPNELYLLAALKGAFRATRRWGSFDAQPRTIVRAMLGMPPLRRPLARLTPEVRYYFHHMGFDHRRLQRLLRAQFVQVACYGSPFPSLPLMCNSEVYLVLRPRRTQAATPGGRRAA